MRGLQGRRRVPAAIIRWGEKGVKSIKYVGPMPCDLRGSYTGHLYVYNARRPILGVDVRDLPGLVKDAGKENLQVRQDDGTYEPMKAPKAAKPKPAKEKDEVNDGN